MNNVHCLIVNINNLAYTKQLVSDLLYQDAPFKLTIYDNGSTEPGTEAYYEEIRKMFGFKIVLGTGNTPLNHLWNWFAKETGDELLCFLNNDIEITSNFISDTLKVFEKEETVGAVVHTTNLEKYSKKTGLSYVCQTGIKQGWDFTVRKNLYVSIPEDIEWFCGDDWIFQQVYMRDLCTAILTSSPIIHYQGKSGGNLKSIKHQLDADVERYQSHGYKWELVGNDKFSAFSFPGKYQLEK